MQTAFEITPDDVFVVLARHSLVRSLDDPLIRDCFDALDGDEIASNALYGDDLDTQTDYAHAAIESSLIEQGLINGPALLTSAL